MNIFSRFLRVVVVVALATFCTDGVAQESNSGSKKEIPSALQVGEKAPDFELQGLGEETIKLSSRFDKDGNGGKPVILLFSRANW